VASYEHNLLPFSTLQSCALLSAESETADAANNKESLVECHDIVWCRTIFRRRRTSWPRPALRSHDFNAHYV